MRLLTYSDYFALDDEKRYELINGVLLEMPKTTLMHQAVIGDITFQIYNASKHLCAVRVLLSPFDIVLPENGMPADTALNVVQPDVFVMMRAQCQPTHCLGAPVFVIEVMMPTSEHHDRVIKRDLYQRYGVREYWLFDPQTQGLWMHQWSSGNSEATHLPGVAGAIAPAALPELIVDFDAVSTEIASLPEQWRHQTEIVVCNQPNPCDDKK